MRNSRSLVSIDDALIIGRVAADVRPRLTLEVPASGLSGVIQSGGKCDHGVYIPATAIDHDRAPNCSLCYHYAIAVRENGIYKA